MYVATTIPEDLLDRLRAGAQRALLEPIMAKRPWQGELRCRFRRTAALLDVLGWEPGEAGSEITIDIHEHALALYEALICALHGALDELRTAGRPQDWAGDALPPGLCGFAALIDAADLERARRDPRVLRFHQEAEALVDELERAGAEFPPRRPPGRHSGRQFESLQLTDSWLFRVGYLLFAAALGLSLAWAEGRPYVLVGACVAIALARILADAVGHGRLASLSFLPAFVRRLAHGRGFDSQDQTR
jgi:nitroreductase